MSKIRSIKPEFWTSEQVAACSRDARLLFIGLWNFCDDAGIHPASILQLKALVFPCDECNKHNIENWVNELRSQGLLKEFAVEGKRYWQVTGWHHQKITKPFFKYPQPPSDTCSNQVATVTKECSNTVSTLSEQVRIGKDRNRIGDINISQVADATFASSDNLAETDIVAGEVKEVFAYWQEIMTHPKAKLDQKRKSKIEQALKHYSVDDLKQAIDGCARTPFNMGSNATKERYDGLELILRDADHIERFMQNAKANPACPSEVTFEGVL